MSCDAFNLKGELITIIENQSGPPCHMDRGYEVHRQQLPFCYASHKNYQLPCMVIPHTVVIKRLGYKKMQPESEATMRKPM